MCIMHRRSRYRMCMMIVHCLQISCYLSCTLQNLLSASRLHAANCCSCMEPAPAALVSESGLSAFIGATCRSHETAASRKCVFVDLFTWNWTTDRTPSLLMIPDLTKTLSHVVQCRNFQTSRRRVSVHILMFPRQITA